MKQADNEGITTEEIETLKEQLIAFENKQESASTRYQMVEVMLAYYEEFNIMEQIMPVSSSGISYELDKEQMYKVVHDMNSFLTDYQANVSLPPTTSFSEASLKTLPIQYGKKMLLAMAEALQKIEPINYIQLDNFVQLFTQNIESVFQQVEEAKSK
jgi:hypothetical protein